MIGMVADAKNRGLQQGIEPEAYLPYTVTGAMERGILVRTGVEPMSMLMLVRREIWAVDRNVALTLTGTLEGYLEQFSYAGPKFGLILLGWSPQSDWCWLRSASSASWLIRFPSRRTGSAYAWHSVHRPATS